ncbi:Hsp20/alpha crystallin family protein [Lentilactobacillus sp. IMAU92037]|uniref:Hsp20/alpha crystallin family protein n=1 Tax=Lentilactobacillus TaxID=2767893 RepID=UPI001C2796BA|nr:MULTISPECIES: Hsp20/alpha crystallin family protein [Lentilactobacillus]MBU9789808.1 Hsp20/alpha crystallin family protein [Lentilactobacillus dabitei]MBV0931299.1 Hsp20/alpha crystallin family protein [Lentilactobacillus dabitei]MDM7515843.1 Hsp20/alpha crystallin family protein [Lentilactobacillus sp. TOM.63]
MANELMNRFDLDPFFDRMAHRFFSPSDFDKDYSDFGNLKTDIKETDKDYSLKVDVPGIDKNNIRLAYQDGVLSLYINQEHSTEQKDENGRVIASERSHGVMSRSYQLPGVDKDNISAQVSDGVLNVTLPKLTNSDQDNGHIEIQ